MSELQEILRKQIKHLASINEALADCTAPEYVQQVRQNAETILTLSREVQVTSDCVGQSQIDAFHRGTEAGTSGRARD